MMMSVRRSVVFLNKGIRLVDFALFHKRDELWEKDKLLIPMDGY
jgi:hypothetical protein